MATSIKKEKSNQLLPSPTDDLGDDGSDDVGSQGNRANSIFTFCRVNESLFEPGHVTVNSQVNEVEIFNHKNKKKTSKRDCWMLDDSVDNIPRHSSGRSSRNGESSEFIFATQHDVWAKVQGVLDERLSLDSPTVGVMCLGGHGSGKTHTMFGTVDGSDGDGILPRFIKYAFDPEAVVRADYMLIEMYVIKNEQVVDVLDAAHIRHSCNNQIGYSDAMGSMLFPVNRLFVDSPTAALDILHTGLVALTAVMFNGSEFSAACNLVVNCHVFSLEHDKHSKVTFVDGASLFTPPVAPVSVDRFSGLSAAHTSSRELHRSVRTVPGIKQDSDAPLIVYEGSVLTYMMQDCLFKFPDCIIVGCLRAQEIAFDDNFATLDFMNRLDTGSEMRRSREPKVSLPLSSVGPRLQFELRDCQTRVEELQLWVEKCDDQAAGMTQKLVNNDFGEAEEDEEIAAAKADLEQSLLTAKTASESAVIAIAFLREKMLVLEKLSKGVCLLANPDKPAEIKVGELSKLFNFLSRGVEGAGDGGQDGADDLTLKTEETLPSFSLKMDIVKQASKSALFDFEETNEGQAIESISILHALRAWLRDLGFDVDSRQMLEAGFAHQDSAHISLPAAPIDADSDRQEDAAAVGAPGLTVDTTDNSVGSSEAPVPRPATAPTALLEMDEQPYLVPVYRMGSFAAELTRIPLKRGYTLVKGTDLPFVKSIDHIVHARDGGGVEEDDDEEEDEAMVNDDATFNSGLQSMDSGLNSLPKQSSKSRATSSRSGNVHYIRVNGPNMCPSHCRFTQQGGVNIQITPNHIDVGSGSTLVVLNGRFITEMTSLADGDVLQLGCARFFRIYIPRMRQVDDEAGQLDEIAAAEHVTSIEDASKHHHHHRHNKSKVDLKLGPMLTPAEVDSWGLLTMWEVCMVVSFQVNLRLAIMKYEEGRRHAAHLSVDREEVSIMRETEKTELMKMAGFEPSVEEVTATLNGIRVQDRARLCESLGCAEMLTYWSTDMRRGVVFEVKLRPVPANDKLNRWGTFKFPVPRIYNPQFSRAAAPTGSFPSHLGSASSGLDSVKGPAVEREAETPRSLASFDTSMTTTGTSDIQLFCADVLCSNKDGEGSWWWYTHVLLERMALLTDMRTTFLSKHCRRNSITLEKIYPPQKDPFADTLDDELIGVGFLYLDPVQYLLDINSNIPIINFSGKTAGIIQLRVRSWIDAIDTQPTYIAVDREANISDFIGHKCIIRIHVDFLKHLPKHICSATYLYFKFFFHSTAYKTPRYGGTSINPAVEHTISIEQKITRDFIDFIRSGCLEMEVFGKRKDVMSKAEEGVSSFTVREPETSCPTHLLFHDSEEDDMTLGEMSRGGDSASAAGAGPGNAGKVDEDGNPIGDDESDEKDELIAYLQRQLEEATTEGARKEKALQQSKKTLSAALLEKAQALAKCDRVDTECQQLKASLAACEATLAQMNKRVEELARNQRPPVVETAVVVAPAPKSSVCVIS